MSTSQLATLIFTRSDNLIKVWSVDDGELVVTIETDTPISLAKWQTGGSSGGILLVTENELKIVKTSNYQYIMGVDGNFRDQFSRLIYGTRVSLMVGLTTVSLAVILGTIAGSLAGFLGGWVDNLIMRIMDVMLAFPSLILAIAVVTVLGPGLVNALLAISIVFIPQYARVARSGVLSVREEDFVMADRALGVHPMRILFRRVLPNALAPLIVQATLGIGTAILDAAALSFLGLGAQPPTAEWGAMLGQERSQIFTAPHLVFFPGIAIMITVLAFNLLGDGLRDALDPRLDR
ncbi:MAG: ABC transporter permease [Chloroflexi bacterium]|nr:ABC transporter permease [Chloroflexota bacterium]